MGFTGGKPVILLIAVLLVLVHVSALLWLPVVLGLNGSWKGEARTGIRRV